MTETKIIHYDSINAIKINNNPLQCTFTLKETILNVKAIFLRSIEIPLSIYNIRSPYNFLKMLITVNGISTMQILKLPNKSYIDVTYFLIDLNALISSNVILNVNEIAPIFSFSTQLNKLVVKTTLSTSQILFYNEGVLLYYLGNINPLVYNKITTQTVGLYIYSYDLLYCYNLCFDIYLSMHICNLNVDSCNNNSNPISFKICLDSITNTIHYNSENSSFVQSVKLPHNTNISNLSIVFYDRYNNIVDNNNYDFSFTLGYEI